MKSARSILLLPLFLTGLIYASQRQAIPLFQWNRIGEYEISNLFLSQTGTVSLSPEFKTIFQTERTIWSAIGWKKYLVVGTAEEASLIFLSEKQTTEIPFSNHQIISALATDDSTLYVAGIPNTTLYTFENIAKPSASYSLPNAYIWSIIPSPAGVWILTGEPAELYLLQGKKLQKVASLSHERHLLKGIWLENALYCIGESSFLYSFSLEKKRFSVAASLDFPIQDIATDNKTLFFIVNTTSQSRSSGEKNPQTILYAYQPATGGCSRILSLSSLSLSHLFFWQEKLYLASSQNFFIYSPTSNEITATGYGKGGVRFFTTSSDRLHLITDRPSRILQMGIRQAREGSLITPIFDADAKSEWGKIIQLSSTPSLTLSTRAAGSPLPDLWEEWILCQNNIPLSSPNRYLQLKLNLAQQGNISLKNASLTYLQINQPPEISQFEVFHFNGKLYFSSSVKDANNDNLWASLAIIRQKNPVTIASFPLSNSTFEFSSAFLPEGEYTFLFTVSDAPSNPSQKALTTSVVSAPLFLDHTPPQIKNLRATLVQNRLQCSWTVEDNRLVHEVWYSIAPGEWKAIFPTDGICDSPQENFEISNEETKTGYIQIKARDNQGNETIYGQWIIP